MNNAPIERLQRDAEIPAEFRTIRLEEVVPVNDEQKALIDKAYKLLNLECKTLLVCGAVGTGKTYLSRAFLNEALIKEYKANREEFAAKYITHYELDLRFRSAMTDRSTSQAEVFKTYARYKYLVIDEFCRGATTDYSMSFIENLISRRYDWSRPTMIITNKTVAELKALLDAQILDRLGSLGQETFALDGKSLR